MNFYYYYMDKPLKYCKSCFIYAYTHTHPELLMGQKVQCKITKLPVHTGHGKSHRHYGSTAVSSTKKFFFNEVMIFKLLKCVVQWSILQSNFWAGIVNEIWKCINLQIIKSVFTQLSKSYFKYVTFPQDLWHDHQMQYSEVSHMFKKNLLHNYVYSCNIIRLRPKF
jgi:hypothetical protein